MTPSLEVDVVVAERQELAEPESGVERGRPDGAVLFAHGGDQRGRLFRRGNAISAAAYGGKLDSADRVDGHLPACKGAAVDRAKRDERVADRARVASLREHLVDEVLDVEAGDLRQPCPAELGQDAQADRSLVAAQDTRLVRVARAVADRPVLCTREPRLPDASKRRGRRRAHRAAPQADERLGAPRLRLVEAAERLADALVLAGAPDVGLVRGAGICSALPDRRQLDSRADAARRFRGSTSPSGTSCDRAACSGAIEPALELAEGDEDAAAAPDDPEFTHHVLIEVIAAHAEDAGGFVGTEGEPWTECGGGTARTWLLGASDRRDLESQLLRVRLARHGADCSR